MTITAKFASVCPCCQSRIAVGDKVEWSKGSKARHVACSGKPAAHAPRVGGGNDPSKTDGISGSGSRYMPSSKTTERVYKSRYGWDGVRGSRSYYSSGMYDEES